MAMPPRMPRATQMVRYFSKNPICRFSVVILCCFWLKLGFNFFFVKFVEGGFDLVAHADEFAPDECFGTGGVRRVVEAHVQAGFDFAQKGGTGFVGASANGDYVIPPVVEILGYRIGGMSADGDADFCHGLNGFGVEFAAGFGAC